jgi:segregation and condensation protein B
MMSNTDKIIEAALFASAEPLTIQQLTGLFVDVEKDAVEQALQALTEQYSDSAVELQRVASGWRFQVRAEFAADIAKLWDKKSPRYSKATLETLSLIAYRQPVTRAEIEEVRGVAVSTQILRNMMDRDWIKVVGRRDVPGKPALFGTTKVFLDYFNLQKLSDLPPLPESNDLEEQGAALQQQLDLLGLEGATVELNSADAEESAPSTEISEPGLQEVEPAQEAAAELAESSADADDDVSTVVATVDAVED